MKLLYRLIAWLGLHCLWLGTAQAAVYEVGPGKALAEPGDAPWESLAPGDTVRIHYRTNAYRAKWVLCRQGTAEAPITVQGVPGRGGERPVIDGNGATTRSILNYWNQPRGIIKIGGANVPPDTTPRHIIVQNLNSRPGTSGSLNTSAISTRPSPRHPKTPTSTWTESPQCSNTPSS